LFKIAGMTFFLIVTLLSLNNKGVTAPKTVVTTSTDSIPQNRISLSAQPLTSNLSLKNNAEANFNILRTYLDSIPAFSTVYLPSGSFAFSKQIEIKKPVRIIGNWNTKIIGSIRFMPGSGGYLKDLEVHSDGKSQNGIIINGISHLENIKVYRFSGNGIDVRADIQANRSNASQSSFRNVEVIECRGNGFYMHGGDANGMTFYNCSARDNGGVGFYDDSFLGNTFIGCMGHANKGGHYVAENGNNRSTFIGCYGEEDSPPSKFGGVSRVTGGLLGYEVTHDKKYYKGTTDKYRGSGGYIITSPHAKVETK
jgi:hypothetical protein